MKIKTTYSIIVCAFLLTGCANLKAQVTIGALLEPVKGALLELKNHETAADSTNATKGGLVLPRVRLVDRNTLQPFIKINDTEWSANAIAKTRTDHIGLTVYNLTNDANFHPGIYTWTGLDWKPIKIAAACIYLPTFKVSWTTNGAIDLFNNVYKENFDNGANSQHVAFPEYTDKATDFYYVVTDYDPNVIAISSISEQGVMSYSKVGNDPAPPENAFINVVMIRKQEN